MTPRVQLLVNGTATPCVSAEVQSNNYYQADTFKADILPGANLPFWCASSTGQTPVAIVVQIDPGNGSFVNLLTGRVDHIEYNPAHALISLTGRDQTADFIDAKTFQAFKNQTSSEIAAKLAQGHGIQTQITATSTPVERYYTQDHDKLTLNDFTRVTTEWDLLTDLAQKEGFDVFVSNGVLHFQPPADITSNPYVLSLDMHSRPWLISNGIEVKMSRALTLARDIEVTVRSWSSREAKGFTVTAKATGTKAASASAPASGKPNTQNYAYTRPNMTHAQAQAFANAKLAELSKHEREVTLEMPGETSLTPRQGLRVTGTGTDFDMAYFTTEITRTIDAREGFRQAITAKNQSPKDTAMVG